jgi:hypothetical protein
MKTVIKKTKKSKSLNVTINRELDKYSDKVLFPKKVAEANEILKKVGTPDIHKKK